MGKRTLDAALQKTQPFINIYRSAIRVELSCWQNQTFPVSVQSLVPSPPAVNFTFTAPAVLKHVVSSWADTGEGAGRVDAPVLTQKLRETALIQVCGEFGRKECSVSGRRSTGRQTAGSLIFI